jgi:hypothetical protein
MHLACELPSDRFRYLVRRWCWLLFMLALSPKLVAGADQTSFEVNALAQERVAHLLQEALGPYRADAESGNDGAVGAMQHLLSVEARFREASALMPERLDLRFGLAQAFVLQAIQTNSQFDLCISNAFAVYQGIQALDTNGFEAPLLYAAYARALGDAVAAETTIRQLLAQHSHRTAEYLDQFQRVESILRMASGAEPRGDLPAGHDHAIVVFGAALATNGAMKPKLVSRLQQALKLARLYPEAPLVLSGGNQKAGITEAYAMRDWLKLEGVSTNRMHLEDRARDTVGNAVYCATILETLGVTHVTLVTSANHIRRALVDLEEACRQRKLPLTYATLVAPGEPEFDPCRERLAIYRDALRAGGLWAFPGIQR